MVLTGFIISIIGAIISLLTGILKAPAYLYVISMILFLAALTLCIIGIVKKIQKGIAIAGIIIAGLFLIITLAFSYFRMISKVIRGFGRYNKGRVTTLVAISKIKKAFINYRKANNGEYTTEVDKLADYMKNRKHFLDGWGRRIKILIVEKDGVKTLKIWSYGADNIPDTEDDVDYTMRIN